MNPFDLKGPDFLGLYIGLFVASLIAAVVLIYFLRTPSDEPRFDLDRLKPYHVAYLAGGARGALAAAVAKLIEQGVLKAGLSSGTLTQEGSLSSDSDPVEEFACERLDNVKDMKQSVWNNESPFSEIRRGLESLELIPSRSEQLGIAVKASIPFFLLSAFGLIKILVGLSRGKPVLILVVLAAATLIIAVLACMIRVPRTRRGDKALALLRSENAALQATAKTNAGDLAPNDLILAAALFGVAGVALPSLGDYQRALAAQQVGSTGGSGGCSGSCGSSCGGGGGCGGGCGGGGCGGCS